MMLLLLNLSIPKFGHGVSQCFCSFYEVLSGLKIREGI